MWKLTIYCCYHDKIQKRDDDKLTKWFYGPDWLLNPYLSEFSMFYDIRKNDKDSDYIGTCHYRRRIYSWDYDENLVNDDSCQVYEIIKSNKYSIPCWIQWWSSKKWRQCEWIRLDYQEYVNHRFGMNNKYIEIDNRLNSRDFFMIGRSSFILTRQHFMCMCDYIFGFLEYIDKRYKLNYNPRKYEEWIVNNYESKLHGWLPFGLKYKQKDIRRLLAYLFEWMASIYLQTNLQSYNLIDSKNFVYAYPWSGSRLEYLWNEAFWGVYRFLSPIYRKCIKF